MAQPVKVLVAKLNDLSFIPRIHMCHGTHIGTQKLIHVIKEKTLASYLSCRELPTISTLWCKISSQVRRPLPQSILCLKAYKENKDFLENNLNLFVYYTKSFSLLNYLFEDISHTQ